VLRVLHDLREELNMYEGPKEGGHSPWGSIQHVTVLADGVWSVDTAGHGGLKLSRERQARMPEYMRRSAGWYEEDCEWSLPVCVMPDIKGHDGKDISEIAKQTFRTWYPDEYERFYGVKILPGESLIRDEQEFYKAHENDWIGIAAAGRSSIEPDVPEGMVKVWLKRGGRRNPKGEERTVYVTKEEYDTRGQHAYVHPKEEVPA
jgi:hypothetical protein